ncbi:FmdB family zinc ribbon protein [Thermodesulfobacteriota bacterium]
MPIYEYECTSCCNVFEVFQRMTEDSLTNCPDCSGPVKKLVSMSSFQLKGGGWYADGYSSKSANGSGSSSLGKSTESPSGKSEKTAKGSSDSSASKKSKAKSSAAA